MANPRLLLEWLKARGLVDKNFIDPSGLTGGEGTAKKTLPPREGVGSTGPGPDPNFSLDDFDFRRDSGKIATPESPIPDEALDPAVLDQLLLDVDNLSLPRSRQNISREILEKHSTDKPSDRPDVFTDMSPPETFMDTSRKFENKATTTQRLQNEKALKARKVPEGKTLDVLDLEGKESLAAHERIERQLISEGLGSKTRAVENSINSYVQDTFTAWNDTFPEFRKSATRADPGLGTTSKRLRDGYKKLSAAGETARNQNATDEVRRAAIKEVVAIREWLTKGKSTDKPSTNVRNPANDPIPVNEEAFNPLADDVITGRGASQSIAGPRQLQEWEVIIEQSGAYGQTVFATKRITAATPEEAIKNVELEGPFSFEETDPFTNAVITSTADTKGISGNPGFVVHAQPVKRNK
jgi:hypothetical protein